MILKKSLSSFCAIGCKVLCTPALANPVPSNYYRRRRRFSHFNPWLFLMEGSMCTCQQSHQSLVFTKLLSPSRRRNTVHWIYVLLSVTIFYFPDLTGQTCLNLQIQAYISPCSLYLYNSQISIQRWYIGFSYHMLHLSPKGINAACEDSWVLI